jgi:hypothetical protein
MNNIQKVVRWFGYTFRADWQLTGNAQMLEIGRDYDEDTIIKEEQIEERDENHPERPTRWVSTEWEHHFDVETGEHAFSELVG